MLTILSNEELLNITLILVDVLPSITKLWLLNQATGRIIIKLYYNKQVRLIKTTHLHRKPSYGSRLVDVRETLELL